MTAACHKWPERRAHFWVPTVDDLYDGGPELAVIAGAHAALALVVRAIEHAHGELEGADNDDLIAMTGENTGADEHIAIEIVRQARSLAATFRAYAHERTGRVGYRRTSFDDPF